MADSNEGHRIYKVSLGHLVENKEALKTILGAWGYQKGTGANFKRPPLAKFGTA